MKIFRKEVNERLYFRIIVSLVTAFAAFALTMWASKLTSVAKLDYSVNNVINRNLQAVPDYIWILGIDEETINEMGSYYDWQRDVYADLVNMLCTDEYSPAVIGFDIVFTGEKSEEGDTAFAEAAQKAGCVVVGNLINFETAIEQTSDGTLYRNASSIGSVSYPYAALKEASMQGFVNNELSKDGYIRTMMTTFNYQGEQLDSFALKIYKIYAEKNGIEVPDYASMSYNKFRFNFATKANEVQEVALSRVLKGEINPALFNNSIVLVGAYTIGFSDDFPVPSDSKYKMYGVEVHANIIDALKNNGLKVDSNKTLTAVIYAIAAGLTMFLLYILEIPAGGVLCLLILLAQFITCRLLYLNGYYTKYIYLPILIVIGYALVIIYRYLNSEHEKAKINKAFKMYVAPQVVDEVAKSGSYELKLGGQTKDIAVLFVDIRGFTTMSESLAPETVVSILNEYFAVITDAIFKNGGTLDKFIGDAAMAVFNSPFDLDDYLFKAVKTAYDIASGSVDLSLRLQEQFGKTVSYGIGVHAGPATIGNIGCDFRMDFTAIGDTVNTSSRLESNAKSGQILISDEVVRRLGDRIATEDVGEIKLKGKALPMHVYNLTGIEGA